MNWWRRWGGHSQRSLVSSRNGELESKLGCCQWHHSKKVTELRKGGVAIRKSQASSCLSGTRYMETYLLNCPEHGATSKTVGLLQVSVLVPYIGYDLSDENAVPWMVSKKTKSLFSQLAEAPSRLKPSWQGYVHAPQPHLTPCYLPSLIQHLRIRGLCTDQLSNPQLGNTKANSTPLAF